MRLPVTPGRAPPAGAPNRLCRRTELVKLTRPRHLLPHRQTLANAGVLRPAAPALDPPFLYDDVLATLPGVQRVKPTLVMKNIVIDRPYPIDYSFESGLTS